MRRAVALMWASIALGIVFAIPAWEPLPPELQEYEFFGWIAMCVGFAIPVALILFVSRQRNWARIALLLLTVAGLALSVAFWDEEPAEPLWSKLSTIFLTMLDLVALYWLFSRPASQWFKARKMEASRRLP